jgi:chromosome segregation ATPase
MLRKIAFAAVAVVAGLFILNSTHLGSYARTAWHKIKKTAKCQVPLEFQLESARNEIAQLIPDMKNHIDLIAQETQAVQRLKDEITLTRANLAEHKKNLLAMKDDLKKGEVKYLYGDRFYSADRVSQKLARDLASCQRCEKELETREKMLEAKETALDAAREQLASMKSEKEKLEVLVEQMEAELKTLRLAQTRSQFHLDDSRLSHIKQTLADIRDQMRAQQTASELTAEFLNDSIPVAQPKTVPSKDQVIKQVEAYLGDDKAESSVAQQEP